LGTLKSTAESSPLEEGEWQEFPAMESATESTENLKKLFFRVIIRPRLIFSTIFML
jgi:hypothetical protein